MKAEVTVPSLDDWEKVWKRAENVESGKLKCATEVAAGGFPVAAGRHRASESARGSGSRLGKYYKTRNRPVHGKNI
jgi:hypothetical protein